MAADSPGVETLDGGRAGRGRARKRQEEAARLSTAGGAPSGEVNPRELEVLGDLAAALRVVHFTVGPHRTSILPRGLRRRSMARARRCRHVLAGAAAAGWRYNILTRGLAPLERAAFDILLACQILHLREGGWTDRPTGLQLAARLLAEEETGDPGRLTEQHLIRGVALVPIARRLVEAGLAVPEEAAPFSGVRALERDHQVAYADLAVAPEAFEALFPPLGVKAPAAGVQPSWVKDLGIDTHDDADVAGSSRWGSLLPPKRCFGDVVLPAALLDQASLAVRFSRLPAREGEGTRGVCVLLTGPPGTGKTLLAEAMAGEINRVRADPAGKEGLPAEPRCRLHVIDYAAIASAFVGENEKRLRAVFRGWDREREVLLFDEADSLLSRRMGATGAHDAVDLLYNRLTNILLKELESLRGGVVLIASNFDDTLDPALERRCAFRLRFEEPGVEERERLWSIHLPPGLQRSPGIDLPALAREFPLTGGLIRNAVERAALSAELRAAAGAPPLLEHGDLQRAASEEVGSRLTGRSGGPGAVGFR